MIIMDEYDEEALKSLVVDLVARTTGETWHDMARNWLGICLGNLKTTRADPFHFADWLAQERVLSFTPLPFLSFPFLS